MAAVNRLLAPRTELFVHEKWFPQSAGDVLLDTDARVADRDRLHRCLDRLLAHKPALEQHLAQEWKDLFGATFDLLLYGLLLGRKGNPTESNAGNEASPKTW